MSSQLQMFSSATLAAAAWRARSLPSICERQEFYELAQMSDCGGSLELVQGVGSNLLLLPGSSREALSGTVLRKEIQSSAQQMQDRGGAYRKGERMIVWDESGVVMHDSYRPLRRICIVFCLYGFVRCFPPCPLMIKSNDGRFFIFTRKTLKELGRLPHRICTWPMQVIAPREKRNVKCATKRGERIRRS